MKKLCVGGEFYEVLETLGYQSDFRPQLHGQSLRARRRLQERRIRLKTSPSYGGSVPTLPWLFPMLPFFSSLPLLSHTPFFPATM